MQEWKLLAPQTFFNEGLGYDTHALYQLPTLRQKCFPAYPTDCINYTLISQPGVLRERLFDCEISNILFISPSRFPPLSSCDDAEAPNATRASSPQCLDFGPPHTHTHTHPRQLFSLQCFWAHLPQVLPICRRMPWSVRSRQMTKDYLFIYRTTDSTTKTSPETQEV